MSPKDAGLARLRRIQENTVERRLLNDRGLPNFGVNFYVLNAVGEYAGVSMYAGQNSQYAACTEHGAELLPLEPLRLGWFPSEAFVRRRCCAVTARLAAPSFRLARRMLRLEINPQRKQCNDVTGLTEPWLPRSTVQAPTQSRAGRRRVGRGNG